VERGVRQQVVLTALSECLSLIRRFGERGEKEFARHVRHLPGRLRELASALESPPQRLAPDQELPVWRSYAAWAEVYDTEVDNPVIAGEEEVIWDMIGPAQGLSVLDVGCGTGRHAVPLARQGARVVGIEPTPEMLARARQKAEDEGLDIHLAQGAIEDLAPAVGMFDLVLCCLVLNHVQDLQAAAGRLAVHVRPGGRLIATDFHPFCLLLGFRTMFVHHGRKHVVPNYLHLPSDYFHAMTTAGLTVTRFEERGELKAYPGLPVTMLLEAQKPDSKNAAGEPTCSGSVRTGEE